MTLPRYKSHKIVEAVKINSLEFGGYGSVVIQHAGGQLKTNDRYFEKFNGSAVKGGDLGYYVRYEDGYESWSPTKAFEEGYTKVDGQDC
jgi:hypothetical protein